VERAVLGVEVGQRDPAAGAEQVAYRVSAARVSSR
jgi:hypothetical protein